MNVTFVLVILFTEIIYCDTPKQLICG